MFGMAGGSRRTAEEEELLEELAEEEEDGDIMQSLVGSQSRCVCPKMPRSQSRHQIRKCLKSRVHKPLHVSQPQLST